MFASITGADKELLSCITRLPSFFWEGNWAEEIHLTICPIPSLQDGNDLTVTRDNTGCRIEYRLPVHLFRGLGLLKEHAEEKNFFINQKMYIPEIGIMTDVSRNSVPSPEFLQSLLDRMALMGLNCLILYMEDVYEIEGEPRFGYMRGGYTREQLRSIDDYAAGYGIRIVASIQVLGHMEKVLRFPEYAGLRDSSSCLLAGSEETEQFICKMLSSIGSCLRSRQIIVGMDETHGLGEGRYRVLNGRRPPIEIYLEHLNRVHALAGRYGLNIAFYSDMLFKYGSEKHTYLDPHMQLDEKTKELIPSDAQLIYWDYYSREASLLNDMLACHRSIGPTVYAGPLLSVSSFCVQYEATWKTAGPALMAVKRQKIPMAYGCLWHDDGAECSDWLGLPGMQYYAEHAYTEGVVDPGSLDSRFLACTGLDAGWFRDAALLDEIPCINPENRWPPNPCKYILWQDPLEGLYDADIRGLSLDLHYRRTAQLLRRDLEEAGENGAFLRVPLALAEVLEIKSALSGALSWHYREHDMTALQQDAAALSELYVRVKKLRRLHREQWMSSCSPFGWSRLDLRYGGLLARLETASDRLQDYLEGRLSELPELAVPRYTLDRCGELLGNGIWKVYDKSVSLSDG